MPQAFVTAGWQLVALRFLMGLALGGLDALRYQHHPPQRARRRRPRARVTRSSSQYSGQVVGPILGGFVGGHIGMRAVFLGTALLMGLGAVYAQIARPRQMG